MSAPSPILAPWPYPRWIAHRGAGKLAPENTLTAFRLGAQHGYRMFECDAKLSADGVPILMHDATLDRTTNGAQALGPAGVGPCGGGGGGRPPLGGPVPSGCWRLAFAQLRRRAAPHAGEHCALLHCQRVLAEHRDQANTRRGGKDWPGSGRACGAAVARP